MEASKSKSDVEKTVEMEPVPEKIITPEDLPAPPALEQGEPGDVFDPFRYDEVRAPRWADAGKTAISCEVRFCIPPHRSIEPGAFLPFMAHPDDPHSHGKDIFAECVAGKWGKVGDYVPPPAAVDARTPVQKLADFLAENPDVMAHVSGQPVAG